ncbi:MAG: cytochrome c-type biogenesis protein CcmH [Anaerolineales bacterium]|nr:cytochrome c-type biogenesis protein CcmH [Anaerolineales bacterium]
MNPLYLKRSLIFPFLTVLALLFSVFSITPVLAQQPLPTPSDDQVNAIAKQMYCPVCENIPLDVCGTQACAQWRDLIREKLSQGWTDNQIKDYFAQQYGDRVLATPPVKAGFSFNWLVYIVPPLAFLLGVFILVRALRAWKVPAKAGTPAQAQNLNEAALSAPENEYVARLEEELRRRQ